MILVSKFMLSWKEEYPEEKVLSYRLIYRLNVIIL